MSIEFWSGVLLSGVIGLPTAIIANLYSEQVREYLDRRKTLRLNKKRSLEIIVHQRILRLVEGEPTQTLLHAEHRFMMVTSILILYLCYAALFGLLYFREAILSIAPRLILLSAASVAMVFTFVITVGILILFRDYRNTMRKVRRFSEYEDQMRKKWGEDIFNG
ncbi:hypothetical protein SAMN05443247_03131 [Bradyrhizobium erythrophlei]|jgi:hypothetical protein|nr:hypothetical protein SAMN05443247_03131 [Bradyrhizobium erythrophlei]